jgi:hypothetical protein
MRLEGADSVWLHAGGLAAHCDQSTELMHKGNNAASRDHLRPLKLHAWEDWQADHVCIGFAD